MVLPSFVVGHSVYMLRFAIYWVSVFWRVMRVVLWSVTAIHKHFLTAGYNRWSNISGWVSSAGRHA